MSDTADSITSKETQDTPGHDVSSAPPPLYSNEEPPPYSSAPTMYPPPNTETTGISDSTTELKSGSEAVQEATVDATPEITSSTFDDNTVKGSFIREVFSVLTVQLLFTFSVVCVFSFSRGETNMRPFFTCLFIFLVVTSTLSYKSFSRRYPTNIVGLVMVTLSLSYVVGTVASFHNTAAFTITMGATLIITVTIIAFSAQTRDFSVWYCSLLILAVDVVVFGFMHLLLMPPLGV